MSSSLAHYVIPLEEEKVWEFSEIKRKRVDRLRQTCVEIIGRREERYSSLRQNTERRNAMNSTLRYFNRLQADLQAICRPYNEIRAVGRAMVEMSTAQREAQKIMHLHQANIKSLQRTLSFLPTAYYTRDIEEESKDEALESKEDFRLPFGDIY